MWSRRRRNASRAASAPPAAALPGQSDLPVWSCRRGITSLPAVDHRDLLRWPSRRVCRRQLGLSVGCIFTSVGCIFTSPPCSAIDRPSPSRQQDFF
ncbi:hypothetical protein ACP4OV_023714 [Aristida adscensionis]